MHRKRNQLADQRANITLAKVESRFSTLEAYLIEEVEDWKSMTDDTRRIFNAVESGFPLEVSLQVKVLSRSLQVKRSK